MRTLSLAAALLLVAGCAEVSSLAERVAVPQTSGASVDLDRSADNAPTDAPRGTWDTEYGTMTFSGLADGRVLAEYDTHDGQLVGTFVDGVYSGTWTEPSSASRCETSLRGTPYWGRYRFEFDAARDAFSGIWSYCEGDLGGSWDGTRN